MLQRIRLFTGCSPEIAVGSDGRILGVGTAARDVAGVADVISLRGRALPGLTDSHVHLGVMARNRLRLHLGGATDRDAALLGVFQRAMTLPDDAWLVGHHLDDSTWPDSVSLTRDDLDMAAAGRPVFIQRRDGHSAWVSSAALAAAQLTAATPDPSGGVVDRDRDGEPTGVVRESAAERVWARIPDPGLPELVGSLREVVQELAQLGLTGVHSIHTPEDHALLGQLLQAGRLPLRVSGCLPVESLADLVADGVSSGHGNDRLRIWGIKVFLDGSLGSGTAEMLDGTGVVVTDADALRTTLERAHAARLNVAMHAIGDGAVRRALDVLGEMSPSWPMWRPRIEHAQCVHSADVHRFAGIGVIASMQPIHAVSDREIAALRWPGRTGDAYAWRTLHDAGAVLAFGSDAPIDSPDPLVGLRAATTWRAEAAWHPELAVAETTAVTAYSRGAAYAVGMEDRVGSLCPGQWCDLTIVDGDQVVATVVAGEVIHSTASSLG